MRAGMLASNSCKSNFGRRPNHLEKYGSNHLHKFAYALLFGFYFILLHSSSFCSFSASSVLRSPVNSTINIFLCKIMSSFRCGAR